MKERIKAILQKLYVEAFMVVRWKIEDTLLDSKLGDTL
jgi:hypothetical protein